MEGFKMAEEIKSLGGDAGKAVQSLEERARRDADKAKRGVTTALVVGVILLAIIFGYLTYLVDFIIKPQLEPESLAETSVGLVGPQITIGVQMMEENLAENAAANVTSLRNEAMKAAPEMRKQAEEMTVAALDNAMDRLDETLDDWIAQMLEEHKEEIYPLIEASTIPDQPDALEEAFRQSLDELIGPKLAEMNDKFNATMDMVDARLMRLQLPDEQLTPDEIKTKEWITAIMITIDDAARKQLGEELPETAVQ